MGWVILGILVIHIGKRTTGFEIWKRGDKMLPWQYLAIIMCFIINIIAKLCIFICVFLSLFLFAK